MQVPRRRDLRLERSLFEISDLSSDRVTSGLSCFEPVILNFSRLLIIAYYSALKPSLIAQSLFNLLGD